MGVTFSCLIQVRARRGSFQQPSQPPKSSPKARRFKGIGQGGWCGRVGRVDQRRGRSMTVMVVRSGAGLAVVPGVAKARDKRRVDIEALVVWAYLRQRVGVVARMPDRYEAEQGGGGKSGCGMNAVDRFVELGGWVDEPGDSGFAVSGDAWAVEQQVERLGGEPARLVRHYGGGGARPGGWDGPDIVARPPGAAAEVIRYDKHWHRIPEHCPVVYVDRRAEREAARQRWFMWWSALSTLASVFRASPHLLAVHEVTGLAAPMQPWEMPAQITGIDLREIR